MEIEKDPKKLAIRIEELLYRAHVDFVYHQALKSALKSMNVTLPDDSKQKRCFSLPMTRWIRHYLELLKVDMANCIWKSYFDTDARATTLRQLRGQLIEENGNVQKYTLSKELRKLYSDPIEMLRNKFISHSDIGDTDKCISMQEMKKVLDGITEAFNNLCLDFRPNFSIKTILERDIQDLTGDIQTCLVDMVHKISFPAPPKPQLINGYTEEEHKILEKWTVE